MDSDGLALVRAKLASRQARPPLQPCGKQVAPLTLAQEYFWAHDRLARPGAYTVTWAFRIEGPLNYPALSQAMTDLVRRHGVLRTHFRLHEEGPVQIVGDVPAAVTTLIDLSALDRESAERAAVESIDRNRAKPLDLQHEGIFQAPCYRLSYDVHFLLMIQHHMTTDGISSMRMRDELGVLYERFLQGQPSSLAAPEFQFIDYADWERRHLDRKAARDRCMAWCDRLADLPELTLCADRRGAAQEISRSVQHRFSVDAELSRAVLGVCRELRTTLFVGLLTALHILLSRYCGQSDVHVRTPVSGRVEPESRNMMGLFVNTIFLRGSTRGNPSCAEAVRRTAATTRWAFAHQEMPVSEVLTELRRRRGVRRLSLGNVTFAMQNMRMTPLTLSDVEVSAIDNDERPLLFDLALWIWDRKEGDLEAAWEYDPGLLQADTVERMSSDFMLILRTIAERSDTCVHDIRLDIDEATLPALDDPAFLGRRPDRADSVDRLFQQQAARKPDAIAAVDGRDQYSFRTLNADSNRLARDLLARGVAGEERVGLMMPRCYPFLAGILGILKAGACFVPLDSSLPARRLGRMIDDSGVRRVLTLPDSHTGLPRDNVEPIDLERVLAGGGDPSNVDLPLSPDNLAYVMFTSGTTGEPKGIGVTHRNIARLVRGLNFLNPGPDETFLWYSNPGFDATTLEVFAPLLNGCRLVVLRDPLPGSDRLADELRRHQVTTLWLTAGLFHQIVTEDIEVLSPLRSVLTGGDVVSARCAQELLRAGSVDRLVNGYGPTENTTFTTTHVMSSADDVEDPLPIGRAFAATTLRVLDPHGRRLRPGVVGELCTGGDGLARGYHGRPGLTAERFVPDAASGRPGERIYCTGDLVSVRRDGNLSFHGRRDHQVKVRGFRIELGDIETALARHEAIGDAVVLVDGSSAEDKQLVAFVSPLPGRSLCEKDLRRELRQRLPAYCVPARFVFLDTLPLNASGKVDRKALAMAPREARSDDARFQPPGTPTEKAIAPVWRELLQSGRIGIDDDFFASGGHSLTAIRLVSRLKRVVGSSIAPLTLFDHPTIRQLAAWIDDESDPEPPQDRFELARVPAGRTHPLTLSQEAFWRLHRSSAEQTVNVATAAHLHGPLNPVALVDALTAIVRRHDVLRSRFPADGDRPSQIADVHCENTVRWIDLRSLPEASQAETILRLAGEEERRRFDLDNGPVWRAAIVRIARHHSVFLLTIHHIAYDYQSERNLYSELEALYRASIRGVPGPLPELKFQMADYAAAQRRWMQGRECRSHLEYWKRQLCDVEPLRLDAACSAGGDGDGDARSEVILLSAGSTQALRQAGNRQGATLFMTAVAVFKALMRCETGRRDLAIGTNFSVRRAAESEPLIGSFLHRLLLRTRWSGDITLAQLIARLRATALAAMTHNGLTGDEIGRQSGVDTRIGINVNYIGAGGRGRISLPGVGCEEVDTRTDVLRDYMIVSCSELQDRLQIRLHYDPKRVDPDRMQRLTRQFRWLLEQAPQLEDAPLSVLCQRAHES